MKFEADDKLPSNCRSDRLTVPTVPGGGNRLRNGHLPPVLLTLGGWVAPPEGRWGGEGVDFDDERRWRGGWLGDP